MIMFRSLSTVLLLMLFSFQGTAQEFVGLTAEEIKQRMRAERKDFHLDETTVNRVYRYLKYVDDLETRTILYFLSDEDVCTFYKEIYENDQLNPVKEHLDTTCRKIADTLWLKETPHGTMEKVLVRRDWFFTVTTRPARWHEAEVKKEK